MVIINKSGIYKIVRVIPNAEDKIYIGSSINMRKRLNDHRSMLKRNTHDNIYLQRAWNKYGEHAFQFEVVEHVEDESCLLEREQFYIEEFKAYVPFGFNICRIPNRQTGNKWTDQQKSEQSKRLRKYYLDKDSPMKGKSHSDEAKQRMSAAKKNLTGDKNPFFDKKHSENSKKKMSESKKGKKWTEERKGNMSINKRGENSNSSKLSEVDVLDIISLLKAGESATSISKQNNVSKQNILCIKQGKTWTHLTKGEVVSDKPQSRSGSKLRRSQVVEIISLLKSNVPCAQIARQYEVRQETINAIKLKRTWKDIPR